MPGLLHFYFTFLAAHFSSNSSFFDREKFESETAFLPSPHFDSTIIDRDSAVQVFFKGNCSGLQVLHLKESLGKEIVALIGQSS